MAHRIYLYNSDSNSGNQVPTYLGEWNYEIPILLVPLLAQDLKADGRYLVSNREKGVEQLARFYDLLAKEYQLEDNPAYVDTVGKLFDFLRKLPHDTWLIDGSDVFTMNEETPRKQAKNWVVETNLLCKQLDSAINQQDLSLANIVLHRSGYQSFLEVLETDWINYGLGYFELESYFKVSVQDYEENGKFGLRDLYNNRITDAIYDQIFEWNDDGIAVVLKNDLYGYINTQGHEIIPCIYDDAIDAIVVESYSIGQVWQNEKTSLIDCRKNELLFPIAFDELEKIHYHYFTASKNGIWKVYDMVTKEVLPMEGSEPFKHDYWSQLFYSKRKGSSFGSSLKAFYGQDGTCYGEFVKDVLKPIANGYIYSEPNKFQTKILVINYQGVKILEDIDQIFVWDNFTTFAYKKAKQWFLFDTVTHTHLLQDTEISNIIINDIKYSLFDYWLIKSDGKLGLFDAKNKKWVIELSLDIKKIEVLSLPYLLIEKGKQQYYFDTNNNTWSEGFDYLCTDFFVNRNHENRDLVCIGFRSDQMFYVLESNELELIEEKDYAHIDESRYNLRGEDLTYWISFYNRWKQQKGKDFEFIFDEVMINRIAANYVKNNDFKNAIRLYEHLANQGDVDSMIELGLLYTDNNTPDLLNIPKGIAWNEQACDAVDGRAFNNLGYFIQNAVGYEYDFEKMLLAYEKAAELGSGMAFMNLGDLYFYGELVEEDYSKALSYYQEAEKKYEYAYEKIAKILYQQDDYKELIKYLKKDDYDQYANIYYGILYDYGYGVKANIKKAISYYEKALKNDVYPTAVERLVHYYGVDSEFKNVSKEERWRSYALENEIELDS